MVLVAVEVHLVFLGPTGVTVFLTKLVGISFPSLRGLALLDLLVFITTVALTGYFNETGINNLTRVCKDALVVKGLIEACKQCLDEPFPDQGFTEMPDGFGIGNLVTRFQPEKALETQTIGNLVLHLVVRKAVEALQNENLEHHGAIKRGTSHLAFVGRLGESDLKDRLKESPVDMCFKLYQRIFQLGQAFQEKMLVEKTQRIDVLHGSGNER